MLPVPQKNKKKKKKQVQRNTNHNYKNTFKLSQESTLTKMVRKKELITMTQIHHGMRICRVK